MNRKQKRNLLRILTAATMLLVLALIGDFRGKAWLYLLPYAVVGYDILADAVRGVVNLQPFDENFLMAVATVGAMALGEYTEGAAVMLFYQIGELFQSVAIGRSRRSIAQLMDLRPDSAEVERGGELISVEPDEVAVGEVITVVPGGRIPIDGVIVDGSSTLNTSALTGESVPRSVRTGDRVQSGCINESGVLRIQTTKEFGESTASKILDLVENAGSLKSKSENFITKFARVYTPAVCFSALALFVLPPLLSLLSGGAAEWGVWLYRALTFLVISCPCALVISIPLTFFAALGGASRAGVLIKGSNYMETLAKVRCIVFDKTGTVTKGVFEVSRVYPAALGREELLDLAAHAECASTHPIARSLLRALGHEPDTSRTEAIQELSGYGVTAKVDGTAVAAGNLALMERLGIACEPCPEAGTAVYVAVGGEYAGCILISDIIKPTAAAAVARLRRGGIGKIVMLTGDEQSAAGSVAAELGADEVYARLLPADKVEKVGELLGSGIGAVAFVGDGINDAPVLMRSDVGIAMGALGSDAAIEAADVVLMDDDPMKIADAIAVSRKALRIVRENIVFAIAVKLACLVLGALGVTNMWAAIFADVGVMVLAVLNALRAMRRVRR